MMGNPIDRRDGQALYTPVHFSASEFQMCDPPCELSDMDSEFLKKLDKLRELCGFPIHLNCAYRSKKHDLARGRDGNSYHCVGRAADLRCLPGNGKKRALIIQNAFRVGLKGVGTYKNFIHVDDRFTDTCWYGESK